MNPGEFMTTTQHGLLAIEGLSLIIRPTYEQGGFGWSKAFFFAQWVVGSRPKRKKKKTKNKRRVVHWLMESSHCEVVQ